MSTPTDQVAHVDTIDAWQCIGCGRVEAPQNCIGICEDRRVELVPASAYLPVSSELTELRRERGALRSLVGRLAWSHPRADEWQRSYRALQIQARALLTARDALADGSASEAA